MLGTWASLVAQLVKDPPASAGGVRQAGSTLGQEDSPGEGNDNLLQYSSLENSMDSWAWWAMVHRFTKSQTLLITHTSCISLN